MFAPIGNESLTGNNDGVDRTATTTATETHVAVLLEAQSSMQCAISPGLLGPHCLDEPFVNSASPSNNKYKTKRGERPKCCEHITTNISV